MAQNMRSERLGSGRRRHSVFQPRRNDRGPILSRSLWIRRQDANSDGDERGFRRRICEKGEGSRRTGEGPSAPRRLPFWRGRAGLAKASRRQRAAGRVDMDNVTVLTSSKKGRAVAGGSGLEAWRIHSGLSRCAQRRRGGRGTASLRLSALTDADGERGPVADQGGGSTSACISISAAATCSWPAIGRRTRDGSKGKAVRGGEVGSGVLPLLKTLQYRPQGREVDLPRCARHRVVSEVGRRNNHIRVPGFILSGAPLVTC